MLLRYKDENGNFVPLPQLTGQQGLQGEQGQKGEPGEMDVSVYDPQGKRCDIFAYIDKVFGAISI